MESNLTDQDLKFRTPFRCCVSGVSGSGKSHLILNILSHLPLLIDNPNFNEIIYCVAQPSSAPSNLKTLVPRARIVVGLEFLSSVSRGSLIVFDDLLSDIYSSPEILDLCIRRSGKDNISCFILTQNLFYQSKFARTINLNFTHIIAFLYPRDSNIYSHLCRQVWGKGYQILVNAFLQHLRSGPHRFFIFDFSPKTAYYLRFRTFEFKGNCIEHAFFLTDDYVSKVKHEAG